MTALIQIDGANITSGTLVAYNASGAVRGVQNSTTVPPFGAYNGTAMFQITLYGDTSGDVLSFKHFPAGGGAATTLTQTVTFTINGSPGSLTDPIVLSNPAGGRRRQLSASTPSFSVNAPAWAAAGAFAATSSGATYCDYGASDPAQGIEDRVLNFEGLMGRYGPDTCVSSGKIGAHGCFGYVMGYQPFDSSVALHLRGHFDSVHGATSIVNSGVPSCGQAAIRIDAAKLNSEMAAARGYPLLPVEAPLLGHPLSSRRYISWMFRNEGASPNGASNPDAYMLLTFEVPVVNTAKSWQGRDQNPDVVRVTCTLPASGDDSSTYPESSMWYYPPCGSSASKTDVLLPARSANDQAATWTHVSVDLAAALSGLNLPSLVDSAGNPSMRDLPYVLCLNNKPGGNTYQTNYRKWFNGESRTNEGCREGLPADYLTHARLVGAAFGSPGVDHKIGRYHYMRGRDQNRRHEFLRFIEWKMSTNVMAKGTHNTINPQFDRDFRLQDPTSILEDLITEYHPFRDGGFEWLPRNFTGAFLIDELALTATERSAPAVTSAYAGGLSDASAHFGIQLESLTPDEIGSTLAAAAAANSTSVPYPFRWSVKLVSSSCGVSPPTSPVLALSQGSSGLSVATPVESRPAGTPVTWSGTVSINGASASVDSNASATITVDAARLEPLPWSLRPAGINGACVKGYRSSLTSSQTFGRELNDSELAAVVDVSGVSISANVSIDSLRRGVTRTETLDMGVLSAAADVPLVSLRLSNSPSGHRQIDAGCSSPLYAEEEKSRWALETMENLPTSYWCKQPTASASQGSRRQLVDEADGTLSSTMKSFEELTSKSVHEDWTHVFRDFSSVEEALRVRRHGAHVADLTKIPSHRIRTINATMDDGMATSRRRNLANAPLDPAYVGALRWSEQSTWGGACPPNECADDTDVLLISSGSRILFDMPSATVRYIVVEGTLVFEDARDALLGAEAIIVHKGGEFIAGSADFPFEHNLKITLYGHQASPWLPVFGTKVLGVGGMGTLQLYGKPVNKTWSLLASDAVVGATEITLTQPVSSDWAAGDKIYIASTNRDPTQGEEVTVASVSADRLTITLTTALAHSHAGHVESVPHDLAPYAGADIPAEVGTSTVPTKVEMRAEVMKLTRSITISGNSPSDLGVGKGVTDPVTGEPVGKFKPEHQFGAQVFAVAINRPVTLQYVAFEDMGQAFNLGKYAVHFHLTGLSTSERDAKRSDGGGAKYIGNSCYRSFNRVLTMHSSRNLDVHNNVAADIMGHAFFLEDGDEEGNSIVGNSVANVKISRALLGSDATPSGFWITNPSNSFYDNRCGGSAFHCYWYDLGDTNTGVTNTRSFGGFANNVAHSCKMGLRLWTGYTPSSIAYFRNYTVFSTMYGIRVDPYDVGIKNCRFDHIAAADNEFGIALQNTKNQGNYDFAQLTNALVVVKTSSATRNFNFPKATAFEFGQVNQYGAAVNSVVVANVNDNQKVYLGCSGCKGLMGGQMIYLTNMRYINVGASNMVRYRHLMEAVYYDTDGTTTGKGPGSWMARLDPALVTSPSCENHIAARPEGMVCDSATELTTIRIRKPEPSNVLFERSITFYRQPDDSSSMDDAAFAAATKKSLSRPFQPYGLCGRE